ncbi:MAG: peptidylprolyl isomerase, partial [Pirellulales bacterium]
AQRFGLPPDQWLKMLENERKISPQQYAKDIIWPMIALRKLADEQLQVTRADVQRAYQTYYGPAVQTRLIACDSAEEAERVRAMAVQDPDEFGNLAKQYSKDPSASAKGLILPIRKHLGDPNIEQAAFSMTEGDISHVIQVGQQYLILKCESIQQAKGVPLAQVEKVLIDSIRDKKLRLVADDVFDKLQKQSQVENVYNDPAKRDAQPGVAALVNGQAMTLGELADECLARHGPPVLDDMIKRRLLVQACRRNKIEVTDADMRQEIARAAVAMGMPDVKSWLKEVVEVHNMSLETYQQDEVWPTAALKKLVGQKVQITDDDMHKSYEANYGPRVRCRAIVLSQLRQAQQVWELARDNPGLESFGALAEQYSVEPGSRAMQGEVPPIQRHGGQPLLEKEAFSLAEGELSSVVQLGDKYVILLCEGRTQPIDVSFDDVKQLIYEDLHEKKLRLVMAEEFTRLEDEAQIDNYLAGTSKAPVKSRVPLGAKGGRPAGPAKRS